MGTIGKTYVIDDCPEAEVNKWFQGQRDEEECTYGTDSYSGGLATVHHIGFPKTEMFANQDAATEHCAARTDKREAIAVRFQDVKQVLTAGPTFGGTISHSRFSYHTNSYEYDYVRKKRVFVPADQLTDKQKAVFVQRYDDYQQTLEAVQLHDAAFHRLVHDLRKTDQEFTAQQWKELKRTRNDLTKTRKAHDKAKKSFNATNSGHRKKLYKYSEQNDGIKWLIYAACAC